MHVVTVRIGVWVDLRRTSESPRTAQIDIALLLQIRHLETTEYGDSIVVGIVVVPLIALRVDEKHHVGQMVIIINYVSILCNQY
jgi:hypothetical protein